MTQPIVMNLPTMNDQQRTAFYASYQHEQKNEATGVLLAVFLGGFGAHHFYLRRIGLGVLYLVFSFTGVTYIIGWIEAFFMPARVRDYNAQLSAYLAAIVTGQTVVPGQAVMPGVATLPPPAIFCQQCGAATPAGVRFCARCGKAMAS